MMVMISGCIWAQEKSVYLMPEISVFENINTTDFNHEENLRLMQAPATTGYSIGIGLRKSNLKRFYVLWALGLSRSPQTISYRAHSSWEGVPFEEHFTNTEGWLKFMVGIKTFDVGSGYFDVSAGLKFLMSLNSEEAQGKAYYASYVDNQTGIQYQYLAAYHELNWGDTRSKDARILFPSIFNFIGQVGYNFNLKGMDLLRVAIEVATKIGADQGQYNNNTGLEMLFDKDRNQISKTTFNDHHTYVGINLSIGL